jgi:hypothetical protein
MLFWMVPAPNEALIVSGSRAGNEATQFRIVTGHGQSGPMDGLTRLSARESPCPRRSARRRGA